jgi:hypothetical protein
MFARIQILSIVVFQNKKKILKKSFIMETSMLPLGFDELNTKF